VDLPAFLDYWRERIERDLAPFADPGTQLEIAADKRILTAHWIARGQSQDAVFTLSLEGGVQVSFKGQSVSYKSFLASPDLADLLGLARMILQAQQKSLFVPTQARLAEEESSKPQPALDLLSQILENEPPDVTRIVMVTGEAGAGKTRVLQELVKQQADLYQRGRTDRLYLYINAQGRALARFNEALATELQDLRAVLTYHAVSALVRVGVLVPIIDGFDELLGVGGYDDAFSSLTGFIEQLDGQGQIVASARSTYYEQEFVSRSSTVSSLGAQAWTQIPLEVLPWGSEQFSAYVHQYATSRGLAPDEVVALEKRADGVFSGQNEDLRRKPLFVARTVDVILRDPSFSGGENLLRQLVVAYLERERKEKLLDRQGGTLLTTPQLELLFKTLAEEMWNQETRELDRKSVREVAEFVLLTEGLAEGVQRVVIERMPQLAFLVPGERSGGVAFEHEMFFSYFLALTFQEKLLRDTSAVRVLLSRSVLPVEVALSAVSGIDRETPLAESSNAQTFLDRLAQAGQLDTPRSSQVKENAGLVAATALKQAAKSGPLRNLRLWGIVIPGGDLNGVDLHEGRLEKVELRRVDLTKTRFIACKARELAFSEIVVNPHYTRLELAGVDAPSEILGLRVREGGLARGVYDPSEVHQILAQCGAMPPPSPTSVSTIRRIPSKFEHLLEKLARTYRRTNPVCTSDDTLRTLFGDASWPTLENLLVRNGVVTREKRSTKGQPKVFLRRQFLPEELMAGADRAAVVAPQIRAFWDDLESETNR
jgi:hypothetical protein